VLARQITYEKVTQRLVGLRLNRPTTVKMRLEAEGKPAGIITSAVISPRFGPIALAVVRRPYFEPGSLLRLETPQGAQTVQVCTLPFS
jgi:glycine cleavage system aminomethyltransferase T